MIRVKFSSVAHLPLLTLLLLALTSPAHANIGDNIDQLRKRYGSAKDMGGQMLFQHEGYSICVYFDGSRSAMEVFVRDGSLSGRDDITQKDIDAILAASGDGMPWREAYNRKGKPIWIRGDSKVIARFTVGKTPQDKFLTVMANER